jgi:CelD/BcsL family acetyltransferase involved in cellulose biosynthesis
MQEHTGRLVALTHRPPPELWNGWRELARGAPPFLAPEFFVLGEALAGAGRPLVATAWDGDRLVGALPLMRDGRTLVSLRSEHHPWFDYTGAADEIAAVWRGLVADPGWDRLILHAVPADSPLATHLPAVALRDLGVSVVREERRSPYFVLPRFEERLAHKHLQNVKRCERKLGEHSLERIPRYDRAALREGLEIEAMAWKRAAGTSIDADPATVHFYTALTRLFGRRGQLSLEFLRAGGRRIGFLLGVEDAGAFYAMKIGYDPAYTQLSPGHILIHRSAAEAEKRGREEYHLLGHDDEWKRRWTDRVRELVTIVVYRGSARGLGELAVREVAKAHVPPRARQIAIQARAELARRRRHCQRLDLVGRHTLVESVRGRLRAGLGVRSGVKRVLAAPPAVLPAHLGAASVHAPGSWVRVLDAGRLRDHLDESDRLRGLAFIKAQWTTCGKVYRVQRSVRRIVDDHGNVRAVNRTVLLEGVTCAVAGEPLGCRRHCPLFYRDEWLEPAAEPAAEPPAEPTSDLWARVRSVELIRAGLGRDERRDGLSFTPEMAAYAGRRLRIVRRLDEVYEHDRWVATRVPIYLLEGASCGGHHLGDEGPCDRACALLWHADWLELDELPPGC